MNSHVPLPLRRLVARRAGGICEYCLIHETDAFFGCEIEHIISKKHGGKSSASNLAWACALCNRAKGSDIATISPDSRKLSRLFNPRIDKWTDHFRIRGSRITGISEVGKATLHLFQLNAAERIRERQLLALAGRFPCEEARRLVEKSS